VSSHLDLFVLDDSTGMGEHAFHFIVRSPFLESHKSQLFNVFYYVHIQFCNYSSTSNDAICCDLSGEQKNTQRNIECWSLLLLFLLLFL